MRTLLFAALVCLSLGSARAAPADDAAAQQQEQQLLKPQEGKITLPGGTATLDLPAIRCWRPCSSTAPARC